MYLYSENFDTSPPFLVNESREDTLAYYQIGGGNESELDRILMITYQSIINEDVGPCVFALLEWVASIWLRFSCDIKTILWV